MDMLTDRTRSAVLRAGLAIAAGFAAAGVQAGPLQEAAAKAESQAAAGGSVAAYETMREAFADFASALPFSIGKALFVAEKPAAFGAYAPRATSVFRSGEPLITYVELVGLTWKPVDGGKLQSTFTVDLELKDSKGATLAAQRGFGSFTFTGYVRNQEIYTHLTLDVTGADPGSYLLYYTVNDVYGSHSAIIEQKFTVGG